MATINFATREIQAKVVYFGATGAGCTTNLERLHVGVVGDRKSTLHGFGLPETGERSWYFEYSTLAPVEGFELRVRVYCLPGGIDLEVHREEVMADVDGVVLVADARTDKSRDNLDALLALEGLLRTTNRELSRMPVVIQVNHTDSPEARPVHDAVFDLNPFGFPVVPAVARAGKGVLETHHEMVSALGSRLVNTLGGQSLSGGLPGVVLTAVHDPRRESDGDVIESHVAAIQQRASITPELDEIPVAEPARRVVDLQDGPEVEVPFQPRALVGSHPVEVLSAELDGDRVRIELVMERMGSHGEGWRTVVWLLNRPPDTLPQVLARSPVATPLAREGAGEVFDYLPPEEPDTTEEGDVEEITDLPGVTYGIMGVLAGVAIGLLSAYLVGAVS